jgi:hypothetical protein
METTTERTTYTLSSDYALSWVYEKIQKLQRRAVKLGLEPISLEVLNTEYFELSPKDAERLGQTHRVEHAVALVGVNPKLSGWSLVAAIDFLGEGRNNIVREAPGEVAPEVYRTTDTRCEHCDSTRKRNNIFVLRHEDGTFKQVGRNCIADFLGRDAERLLQWAQYVNEAVEATEDDEKLAGGSSTRYTNIKQFLAHVSMAIRTSGWVPRSAESWERPSTSSVAMATLYPFGRRNVPAPEQKDFDLADATLDYIRTVLVAKTNLTSYDSNLVALAAGEFFETKYAGMVASMIRARDKHFENLLRHQEIEKSRQREKADSDYVAAVGDRIKVRVTVLAKILRDSDWGVSANIIMVDAEGNKIVWYASGEREDIERGGEYTLAATVKKHDLYKEVKTTYITRAKVVETHVGN